LIHIKADFPDIGMMSKKEGIMSITSIIILAAIVSAFVLFGAVLAWGEYQTRHLTPCTPRRIGQSGKSRASTVAEIQIAASGRNPERASESASERVH
jgi:hypothetical protein